MSMWNRDYCIPRDVAEMQPLLVWKMTPKAQLSRNQSKEEKI